jgi:hypothetical protein
LLSRKTTGQRNSHRILAKFIRSSCAHGSSSLLHITLSKERHQTATGPNRPPQSAMGDIARSLQHPIHIIADISKIVRSMYIERQLRDN